EAVTDEFGVAPESVYERQGPTISADRQVAAALVRFWILVLVIATLAWISRWGAALAIGVVAKEREVSNFSAQRDAPHRASGKADRHTARASHGEAAGTIERDRGDDVVGHLDGDGAPSHLDARRGVECAGAGRNGFRTPQQSERRTRDCGGHTKAAATVCKVHVRPH
ncbi:MAG: hypothetical protein IH827_08895, partial [Myxococcales bacterium]|nr:hypothetical protein [Myxococcales bacterium]